MLNPNMPPKFYDESNKPPSINEQHNNSNHATSNGFSYLGFRRAKQEKCSNPDRQTKAATQNINYRPTLNRFPVEATKPHIARTMPHNFRLMQSYKLFYTVVCFR